MPVEDHPTHERTVVGADFRYTACQNKVRQPGYFVLTRDYFSSGSYELRNEWVQDTSSPHCRYMEHDSDAACRGCPQPKDLEYIEKMKGLK